MNRDLLRLVGIAAILLIALLVAAGLYLRSQDRQQAERVERAKAQPGVFERSHSPTLGPESAPVTLVEFMDPECESCRLMHPIVKRLLSEYPSELRHVVRYLPLQPNSMLAAGALHAAGQQGRYWDMLDVMFENQPVWGSHHAPRPDLIPTYAEEIGLDMEAFRQVLEGGAYRLVVDADQADGRTLGVRGTPTFFVNERRVSQLGYEPLKRMIEAELAR